MGGGSALSFGGNKNLNLTIRARDLTLQNACALYKHKTRARYGKHKNIYNEMRSHYSEPKRARVMENIKNIF